MASQKLRKFLAPILFPISMLYGAITSIRNGLFNLGVLKSHSFPFPVISVGNITVGGTGKTPHVEYLIELLSEKFSIAYLSRGYRRKTKGYILADKNATPENIGDEACQINQKFSTILVAVDENRVHGIETLKKHKPDLNCIILDDAFQHRRVQPGVSILLIDYHRPLQNDYLLPFGNLREKRHGIHRANIVIVTKVPHEIKPIEKRIWIKELKLYPYQFLYFSYFDYGSLMQVYPSDKHTISLDKLREDDTGVLLITGIANPKPMYDKLIKHTAELRTLHYNDHYEYSGSDLIHIIKKFNTLKSSKKLIVTTEKDAVKLRDIPSPGEEMKKYLYYLPVKVRLMDDKGEELNENIIEYVKKNKGISRLHC